MTAQSYPLELLPFIEEDLIYQPEWRGELPESISTAMLATYFVCPQRYKLSHIDMVPWDFIPSDIAIKMAVQACIENHFRLFKAGMTFSFPTMMVEFVDYWRDHFASVQLESGMNHSHAMTLGREILSAFSHKPVPEKVLSAGERLRRPLVNFVTGTSLIDLEDIIDLVETDHQGFITVVNYCIDGLRNGEVTAQAALKKAASSYLIRSEWNLGKGPIPVRNDLFSSSPVPHVRHTWEISMDADEQQFVEQAEAILRGIRDQIFPARCGDHCGLCPVKSSCQSQSAQSAVTERIAA